MSGAGWWCAACRGPPKLPPVPSKPAKRTSSSGMAAGTARGAGRGRGRGRGRGARPPPGKSKLSIGGRADGLGPSPSPDPETVTAYADSQRQAMVGRLPPVLAERAARRGLHRGRGGMLHC